MIGIIKIIINKSVTNETIPCINLFILITSFPELNDNLNGNILTYNESEDAYYIQHGADAVPKKLGKSTPEKLTVFSGNSISGHAVDITKYDGWETFTKNNFLLDKVSINWTSSNSASNQNAVINRYDATTGTLYLNSSLAVDGYGYAYFVNYSVILIS